MVEAKQDTRGFTQRAEHFDVAGEAAHPLLGFVAQAVQPVGMTVKMPSAILAAASGWAKACMAGCTARKTGGGRRERRSCRRL